MSDSIEELRQGTIIDYEDGADLIIFTKDSDGGVMAAVLEFIEREDADVIFSVRSYELEALRSYAEDFDARIREDAIDIDFKLADVMDWSCRGITSKGNPCSLPAGFGSDSDFFCYHHEEQEDSA